MNYRYQNIGIKKLDATKERYYVNNLYPVIPVSPDDTYVITVLGDRLDLLSFDFYGDTDFWWVIASANALTGDSLYLEPGSQIRIPSNLSGVINGYRLVNTVR